MNTLNKLYEKNELSFALVWIAAYCLLQSLANPLSQIAGVEYSVHALISLTMTAALLVWLRKSHRMAHYGLCRPSLPARSFLWYLPLVVLSSSNLWNGVALNMPAAVTALYAVHMLCVGFVEEILFRGFLFRAIAKDDVRSAALISSVTFGLGHLLNLFNGSGMTLFSNLCQVFFAMAVGFLFVFLYARGGSLLPCIAAHSAIDVLSAFANEAGLTPQRHIAIGLIECAIAAAYLLFLAKTLPKKRECGSL